MHSHFLQSILAYSCLMNRQELLALTIWPSDFRIFILNFKPIQPLFHLIRIQDIESN